MFFCFYFLLLDKKKVGNSVMVSPEMDFFYDLGSHV